MPNKRKELIVSGEYYHVFNKVVAGEEIFVTKSMLLRSLDVSRFYRYPQEIKYSRYKNIAVGSREEYMKRIIKKYKPSIDILSYCFMPNHFHFLFFQNNDFGISRFVSNFQNSLAKYVNTKNSREGALFKHSFKSRRIVSEEDLINVSRYIHLNRITSYLMSVDEVETSIWTSLPYYMGNKSDELIETKTILASFLTKEKYLKFIKNQVDYQRSLSTIKHLIFE